jgi:CheY-like chemotaxis protein
MLQAMALSGRRILVVEDEPVVALMIEDMLTSMGATVIGPASNLPEALALAHGEAIDAALLDVNLNGEDGRQVAVVLKARGVPFVFATGYGAWGRQAEAEILVVRKPFSSGQVAAALALALGED